MSFYSRKLALIATSSKIRLQGVHAVPSSAASPFDLLTVVEIINGRGVLEPPDIGEGGPTTATLYLRLLRPDGTELADRLMDAVGGSVLVDSTASGDLDHATNFFVQQTVSIQNGQFRFFVRTTDLDTEQSVMLEVAWKENGTAHVESAQYRVGEASTESATEAADAVLDEALSGHTTAGSLGKSVADIEVDATAILSDTNAILVDTGTDLPAQIDALTDLTADQAADAIWDELLAGHVGALSFGAAIADIETDATAILSDTNAILVDTGTDLPAQIDALTDLTAVEAADAIWDELLAGHTTASTFGKALADIEADATLILSDTNAILVDTNATIPAQIDALTDLTAVEAADAIWDELLAGHVGALSFGAAIADIETDAALILSDTNAILVDTGTDLPAQIDALTDLTADQAADAIWDELLAGHTTAVTFGKAIADIEEDTNELQLDWEDGGRLDDILDTVLTAVQAVQNNTHFTAAIKPEIELSDSGSVACEMLANTYDSNGQLSAPDDGEVMVRIRQTGGTFIKNRLFEDVAFATPLATSTDPVVFPGFTLAYSNLLVSTFQQGEIVTGDISGATGEVETDVGSVLTLIEVTGVFTAADNVEGGTSGATADVDTVTDGGWSTMKTDATGKFSMFYKNTVGDTDESLIFEFGWQETDVENSSARPVNLVVDSSTLESKIDIIDTTADDILVDTSTTIPDQITALNNLSATEAADQVWDELLAGHVAADTFGKSVADIEVDAAQALVDIAANQTDLNTIIADIGDFTGADVSLNLAKLLLYDRAVFQVAAASGAGRSNTVFVAEAVTGGSTPTTIADAFYEGKTFIWLSGTNDGEVNLVNEYSVGAQAAEGNLTALQKSDLAEADTFTISDGTTSLVFEFDGVTGAADGITGDVVVDVSGDTTADDVAVTMRAAINGAGFAGSGITAGGATDQVTLLNDADGALGNVTITESISGTGGTLTPTGMSSGQQASEFELAVDNGTVVDGELFMIGQDDMTFLIGDIRDDTLSSLGDKIGDNVSSRSLHDLIGDSGTSLFDILGTPIDTNVVTDIANVATSIANLQTDVGDFSANTNLSSLLDYLGGDQSALVNANVSLASLTTNVWAVFQATSVSGSVITLTQVTGGPSPTGQADFYTGAHVVGLTGGSSGTIETVLSYDGPGKILTMTAATGIVNNTFIAIQSLGLGLPGTAGTTAGTSNNSLFGLIGQFDDAATAGGIEGSLNSKLRQILIDVAAVSAAGGTQRGSFTAYVAIPTSGTITGNPTTTEIDNGDARIEDVDAGETEAVMFIYNVDFPETAAVTNAAFFDAHWSSEITTGVGVCTTRLAISDQAETLGAAPSGAQVDLTDSLASSTVKGEHSRSGPISTGHLPANGDWKLLVIGTTATTADVLELTLFSDFLIGIEDYSTS